MKHKPAKIASINYDARNVPISTAFDDPYFSFNDGFEESTYVYLEGNQLTSRLRDGFHVGEIGFGTGLNFFSLWSLWRELGLPGCIYMTSFELYPLEIDDQVRALSRFETIQPLVKAFAADFDGENFITDEIRLRVIMGDARETLPVWKAAADAWFLDGFAPSKNPECWEDALLQSVYEHTKSGGSFSSFSAAGAVRAALVSAGFMVERLKGYGYKRHMIRGLRHT